MVDTLEVQVVDKLKSCSSACVCSAWLLLEPVLLVGALCPKRKHLFGGGLVLQEPSKPSQGVGVERGGWSIIFNK